MTVWRRVVELSMRMRQNDLGKRACSRETTSKLGDWWKWWLGEDSDLGWFGNCQAMSAGGKEK